MINHEIIFNDLTNKLSSKYENVEPGKMMSSPGITYKSKVFAFFYNDKMVFRLGRNFNIEKAAVSEYELLSPFKNKPPMADWFVISATDQQKWELLAEAALTEIKNKIDKKI